MDVEEGAAREDNGKKFTEKRSWVCRGKADGVRTLGVEDRVTLAEKR